MDRRFPIKSVVNFLSQTPLFKMCESSDLYNIAETAKQESFKNGSVILHSGRSLAGLGVAVQEVMNFDEAIRGALANDAPPEELIEIARKRKRFFSFAQTAFFLMSRRLLSPSDALLLVAD